MPPERRSRPNPPRLGLRLIAGFKLVKAAAALAFGIGALRLLSPEWAGRTEAWLVSLALDQDDRLVASAAAEALRLLRLAGARQLGALAAAAFFVSAVYVVQGIGLALGRRWAEYLTVVVTTVFLPVELMALWNRFTLVRAGTVGMNIAVVTYLVVRLRSSSRRGGTIDRGSGAGTTRSPR